MGGLFAATLLEYRLPGQRGSAHRAWVPADLFCTEAARLMLADATFGDVTVTAILQTDRREPLRAATLPDEPWPLPEVSAEVQPFPPGAPPPHVAPEYEADWHERAAIMEFDGMMPRRVAEQEATRRQRPVLPASWFIPAGLFDPHKPRRTPAGWWTAGNDIQSRATAA
jgi:hypothetical protein